MGNVTTLSQIEVEEIDAKSWKEMILIMQPLPDEKLKENKQQQLKSFKSIYDKLKLTISDETLWSALEKIRPQIEQLEFRDFAQKMLK